MVKQRPWRWCSVVTVGFIAEGDSETILLKDDSFTNFLASLNISCNKDLVINAQGKNNLYNPNADFNTIERKVNGWIQLLQDKGAGIIIFLIDFDNSDPCFTQFKSKIFHTKDNHIVIAKQALEAWYLADHKSLSNYLQKKINEILQPESFLVPFDEIKALKLQYQQRGISDKKFLTKDMIKSGFSLANAASHSECPSALYFYTKLKSLNPANTNF
ncbi:MAG TPA: hypothetical protein PLP23_16255 [Panacibacter sp.]|nr:hypothetical protein [Panacibacter sp.]